MIKINLKPTKIGNIDFFILNYIFKNDDGNLKNVDIDTYQVESITNSIMYNKLYFDIEASLKKNNIKYDKNTLKNELNVAINIFNKKIVYDYNPEIKPLFKIIDSKTIAFTIEFDGISYPISLLDSPSAAIAWKKFTGAISTVNTIRKRDGKPEITYDTSLQALIESMMVNVKLEFDEIKKKHQEDKEKKQESRKSKKPSTIGCSVCGSICNLNPDGMNYTCSSCGKEFNEHGEYTKYPWYDEPSESEYIECNTIDLYNEVVSYISDHVVFPKPIFYHIYALWCISTYKLYLFDTTGYMNFEAAGNEKGKTRALEVGKELTYRCILTTRPTVAFLTKALTDGAVIMIDQAENAFFEKGYRTSVYDVWTSGYKRGICIGKLSAVDHVSYDIRDTFGAKATSMQEDAKTDNPIKSRTFNIPMQKGTPQNKTIDRERSKKIRNMLYCFKKKEFEYNKSTILAGRVAELIDPLIFTARMLGLDEKFQESLMKYAFELIYEKAEDTSDTLPYHVLEGISNTFGVYSQGEKERMIVTPKCICEWLKEKYPETHAGKYPLSPQKVGSILKKMGFEKLKHTSEGSIYDISGNNIHNLELFTNLTQQYKPDSIEDEIQNILNKFIQNGAIVTDTFIKSLQEKDATDSLLELKKYSWLLEKITEANKKASEVDVKIEPPVEEDEPENPEEEAFKQYQESMILKDEE